jgi:subtilisin-like proprotein convertase family protein
VNDAYGFGAIDAGAAVLLAPGVRPRGPERSYSSPVRAVAQDVPDNSLAGVTSTIVVPQRLDVERVQVVLNAPHPRLGDYTIELTSPSGTRSLLALTRSDSSFGYAGWVFTSVRHWDERSNGPWTLRVSDRAPGQTGRFEDWQLLVYAATPPCPCDWNARGGADILDIFDFLGDWFAGAADFDGNGQTDLPDIFAFLGCWFAGCP